MKKGEAANIGVVIHNAGPGTGFHSEASGVGTTGTKIVVGSAAPNKAGSLGVLTALFRKLLNLFTRGDGT